MRGGGESEGAEGVYGEFWGGGSPKNVFQGRNAQPVDKRAGTSIWEDFPWGKRL